MQKLFKTKSISPNEPESDGRSEPTSDPTSTRAGSLWPSGGTCGRLRAPFGSLWGALGFPLAVPWDPFGYLGPPFGSLWGALGLPLAVFWGPFGHRGAQGPPLGPGPGRARPALGPVRKNLRKQRVFTGFSIPRMPPPPPRREGQLGPG